MAVEWALLSLLLTGTLRSEDGWPVWAEQEPSRIVLQTIFPDKGTLAPGDTTEAFNPAMLEKVEYVEVASYVPGDLALPDSAVVASMRVLGGGKAFDVPLRYRVETSNWAGDLWKMGSTSDRPPQIARWPFLARPRAYYSRLVFDPPRRLWKVQFRSNLPDSAPPFVVENVAIGYASARKPRVDRPPPVYVDGRAFQWHFMTEDMDPGWMVAGAASTPARGADQLTFHSNGLATYIVTPRGLALDARRTSCVEIQMRVDTGLGGAMLFWTTEDDTLVDYHKAQPFDLVLEGGYGRYLVRLGRHTDWRGTVDRLGLVPVSHPGRVQIDWIETFPGRHVGFLLQKIGPIRLKSWLVVLVAVLAIAGVTRRGTWGVTAALCLVLALVSLIPLDFYPNLTFKIAGERFFLLLILMGTVCAGYAARLLARKGTGPAVLGWPEVLLSLFLIWCAVSGAHVTEIRLFKMRLRELLLPGMLVLLVAANALAGRHRRVMLGCVMALGAVVAGIACWEYLLGRVPFYDHMYRMYARAYYDYQPITRASGSMVHPLPLSTYLLGVIPIGVGFLHGSRGRGRLLAGAAVALMVLCLTFTFSRHAWIAALAAVGLLTGGSRRKVIGVVAAALVVVLAGLVIARPGGSLGRSLYAEKRAEGVRTTAALLKSSPWRGTGLGGYAKGRELVRPDTPHPAWSTPDNTYLRILSETGIVGGALWLAFVIAVGRELKKTFHPGHDALARGTAAGFGAMAFSFLFYDGLYWVTPCFLFFLLAGVTLGAVRTACAGTGENAGGNA
jgi:O-antigen ligase